MARDIAWALANSELVHDQATLERAIAAMARPTSSASKAARSSGQTSPIASSSNRLQ